MSVQLLTASFVSLLSSTENVTIAWFCFLAQVAAVLMLLLHKKNRRQKSTKTDAVNVRGANGNRYTCWN